LLFSMYCLWNLVIQDYQNPADDILSISSFLLNYYSLINLPFSMEVPKWKSPMVIFDEVGGYLYLSKSLSILLTRVLSCQGSGHSLVTIVCSSHFQAINIISSLFHINIAVLIAISLSGIIQKSSHCFLSIQGSISFIISLSHNWSFYFITISSSSKNGYNISFSFNIFNSI